MRVKLKGIHPTNRTIPSDLRGRTYDIGTITCGVILNKDGLTLMITKNDLASFLKKEFELRKFKGISKRKR